MGHRRRTGRRAAAADADGEHVLVDSGVNTDKNAVPDFLREKGVEEIEYAVFTHPARRPYRRGGGGGAAASA